MAWAGGDGPGRVGGVRGVEGLGPLGPDLGGGAVVHRCWRMQSDAGVAMNMVVVLEEVGAEGPGVLDGAEAAWERRAVLEGLEVRLRVRVVPRCRLRRMPLMRSGLFV